MLKKLWLYFFGSYDDNVEDMTRQKRVAEYQAQREKDRQVILEMIEEANKIARGEWITEVGKYPPVIPERRRKARN